ncbi:aryl-sulfate sulfotransferase [Candidatus Albibeggiatoa sp. nov. BB20]|uniref:aryl-sulfate sulfotransferase n=1 Tax=Candidatus Albibeggiatoa sp. nov. BB20 TaxID=3162723 RepID=UPI003365998A
MNYRPQRRVYLLIYLFIMGMIACQPSIAATNDSELIFTSTPQIVPNPNPAVPLAALLRFQTNKPVQTHIQITLGDNHRIIEYPATASPQQDLTLIGFNAGQKHQVNITVSDPETATSITKQLTFNAPKLPTAIEAFPIIETKRLSNVAMEAGITLFNPRRRIPVSATNAERANNFGRKFGLLVAVDEAGDVIWYYQADSRISDFELLDNGHIIFLTQDFRAVEIDLLGNVITQWYAKRRPKGEIEGAIPVDTLTFHHDIDVLPNGNFLVLGSERQQIPNYYDSEEDINAPRKTHWVMVDVVIEFNREGKIVWQWNIADYMDVFRIGYETFGGFWERRGYKNTIDWSHVNTMQLVDENSILLSSRYQSALFMVDRNTKQISWIAGEPSGWDDNLRPKLLKMQNDAEWFWHQHSPVITSRGTLLLFDNQNYQTRPFDKPIPPAQTRSCATEYRLDIEQKTLQPIWDSIIPNDPAVASYAMGSTQYLETTGNILVGYGFLLSQADIQNKTWHTLTEGNVWTRAREYTHDSPAQVVWELQLKGRENDIGLGWTLFGARRIPHFPPIITTK